jgi:hypothetical protein
MPSHGSFDAISSSGIAIVSNGTISVARITVRMKSRPLHPMKTKANAAIEQASSERITVTPVTSTEFMMNRATGARSKAAL